MNKPRRWAFLCIWYENSWFWVHEVKRPDISLYMALCIPFHLWQRTSRIYQDHPCLHRTLTSFVPPAHNQGVSLAPLQGLALWKIFLPTTGSFFILYLLTFRMLPHSGTLRWTFHRGWLGILLNWPVTAVFNLPFPPDGLNTTVVGSVPWGLLLFCLFIQPAPVACGYPPSSLTGHSPRPLSV